MAQLKTKKGQLTAYAFACGYIETAGNENDAIILDALHSDKLIYRLSWWEGNYRRVETYRRIDIARKAFNMVKSMKTRCRSMDKL